MYFNMCKFARSKCDAVKKFNLTQKSEEPAMENLREQTLRVINDLLDARNLSQQLLESSLKDFRVLTPALVAVIEALGDHPISDWMAQIET